MDRLDDIELFRRLYDWKLSALSPLRTGPRQKAILDQLAARFSAARNRPARELVLRKFDLSFDLTEPAARALYRIDPLAAGPFILKHLPWVWAEDKRPFWQDLLADAEAGNDETFRWKLYRRQAPRSRWAQDVAEVCGRAAGPEELHRELERRHPDAAFGCSLGAGLLLCLEKRGREALPYVLRHLRDVRRGLFTSGDVGRLLDFARERGWWDLWAGLIRTCAPAKEFNQEVRTLAAGPLPREEKAARLAALAGVSREFNFAGLGFAAIHQLDEATALALLDTFPTLLRGPFRAHLQVGPWGGSYEKLVARLIEAGEEELLDHVAARIATRSGGWLSGNKNLLAEAERLSDYYAALKADPAVFSRRAASVLGRIPAYSISFYHRLIRENRLARLLFERSAADYLADPGALTDLVEASEIHVMALAYRALGLDDDRARTQAAEHLPLLLGTLLRALQRPTRKLAFRALANAAATPETAARILARAREALDLPDEDYPKEALLGLIARILDRWPALRGAAEEPVVYGRHAA